ncbi:MAG: hypothetical protein H7270_11645 [Dermatophilaceae bacterium]|nr:hypothetical protein [Dermatophilaceae bacterium]
MNPDGSRTGRPIATTDPLAVETPTDPPVYHVWLNLSNLTSHPCPEYPGLVIGWRRVANGFEAQVVYVIPSREQRYSDSSQIGWFPAHKLKPRR